MKTIWRHWTSGWSVFGQMFPFLLIVWLILLPLGALPMILPEGNEAIFTNGVFNWQSAVRALLFLFLFPISLSVAAKTTGCFRKQKENKENNDNSEGKKESEPAGSGQPM